jgi:hypothetical protein
MRALLRRWKFWVLVTLAAIVIVGILAVLSERGSSASDARKIREGMTKADVAVKSTGSDGDDFPKLDFIGGCEA